MYIYVYMTIIWIDALKEPFIICSQHSYERKATNEAAEEKEEEEGCGEKGEAEAVCCSTGILSLQHGWMDDLPYPLLSRCVLRRPAKCLVF